MYVNVESLLGGKDIIYHIFYDKNGKKRISSHKNNLNLMIGIETTNETEWKSLDNKNLECITFSTLAEYSEFNRTYQDIEKLYGVINPSIQFISNHYDNNMHIDISLIKTFIIDIETGMVIYDKNKKIMIGLDANNLNSCTLEEIETMYPDNQNKLVFRSDKNEILPYTKSIFISVSGFPDIACPEYPVLSISIRDNNNGIYHVVSLKDYDKYKNSLGIDPEKINFFHAKDEKDLFQWFFRLIKIEIPDIIIGWNSDNFDFPYLINRSIIIFGDIDEMASMLPYGSLTCTFDSKKGFNGEWRSHANGIYLMDYMRIYKKFIKNPREMYSLDYISSEELGETKHDYSEYDNLIELWEKNPQKFIDYNIYDCELISLLDSKLRLINTLILLAYEGKSNFTDALGTIALWDNLLYNELKNKKILAPPLKKNVKKESYAGAYVKNPETKIHNWLISEDVNSLYPHLQMQFNISPECLVENEYEETSIDKIDNKLLTQVIDGNKEYILAGNGRYFRKDIEGFIPKILKKIYNKRVDIKNNMKEKQKELKQIIQQLNILEGKDVH